MAELLLCQKDSYYDSVTLMTLSNQLKKMDGINNAVVSMGTPMNKELLENIGLLKGALTDAGPNDLLIAICSDSEKQCQQAYEKIDGLLHSKKERMEKSTNNIYHTISEAKKNNPDLNLAIISVKGEFAAREAKEALKKEMHVMLFSDNVSLQQELHLKQTAHEKGLLVMGPDCGTAILGGTGLCFSNEVRRGNIGMIAASGTGLQEVCVLADQMGGGISQAIGTGGRDLSAEIGGIMMLDALQLLNEDEDTKVIVLISKPPVESVAKKIIKQIALCHKPVVVCFIAGSPDVLLDAENAVFAANLEDAAAQAVALEKGDSPVSSSDTRFPVDKTKLKQCSADLKAEQKYIRGLYCGGTLTSEALSECSKKLPNVYSNVAKNTLQKLKDPMVSCGHCFIDLGDDLFTVGRPHPMIEPELRCERILQEVRDAETAVLLLDFEIGYGSCEDPVGVTIDALKEAQDYVKEHNRKVVIIGYVQGTDKDFQEKSKQQKMFENIGVIVAQSNLHAVTMALQIIAGKEV